ncbi:nuclear transport factor 2 family protein [Asticcacaulis sp. 201]|uniref:nuclear transport factor 2 family protein n=1 Tax=Asticcacaulis sp. 201 TaxID=3028787 RepID=UPI0029160182|nr:nuclear transport factor 2 family protein [Asticcacaulis sp. 201]MDV6331172.1 nuclear transport factor 2 family protein [Asticcacaulis sp. 201]
MNIDLKAFADDWVAAWNAHDIERVLAHFDEDAIFTSPFATRIRPDSGGRLQGKAEIRDYWSAGIEAIPDLHFTVEAVFAGVDHLVILYTNQAGVRVSEVLRLRAGRVIEGHGTYPPDVVNPTGARMNGPEDLPPSVKPVAVIADEVPVRVRPSNYPEPFASRMAGRAKRQLGDIFGLGNFGVNLTELKPGAMSALRHAHSKQDEFVYILAGFPTLFTDEGETRLTPGMCAGFKAGTGNGHHLINTTDDVVVYLEVGDRSPGDEGTYPDDDLKAILADGRWRFVHKDGTPY